MAARNLPEPVPGVAVDPLVLERLVARLEVVILRANQMLPRDLLRTLAYAAVAQLAPVYEAKGEARGRRLELNAHQVNLWDVAFEAEAKALERERERCARLAETAGQDALALAIRYPPRPTYPGTSPSGLPPLMWDARD